eukprot:CAMPEP_0180228100 /NCGR_PEP_ID=MMETSP0987-20121128/24585_1 /TAXON_ID=697907 /ORGANISM="non described non described, Strain CCMP2293" /LENGTH=232 /DNA_ID=CAMNT_0022192275 /DNA_START=267 /DNA_END=962 /DNA_ORIENTATION=-
MASGWTLSPLKGRAPRDLRLAGANRFSDNEVVSRCEQLADFLLGQKVPGDRRAIALAVHVEDMGFSDRGAIALCEMLTKLHQMEIASVHNLFMFKLNLTDLFMESAARLIAAHAGYVREVHLSHNRVTARGCDLLLCEEVLSHYPIKCQRKEGFFMPLFVRLEHNDIRGGQLRNIKPWMYTAVRDRNESFKTTYDQTAPIHLPYIDLREPPTGAPQQRPRPVVKRPPAPGPP